MRGGKSSLELVRVTKKLFLEVSERNIHLSLHFFESCANKRRLFRSDVRLSQGSFASVSGE